MRVSGARTDVTTLLRQPEATLEHIHAPPLVRNHDGRRPTGVQRRGNGDDVEAFPELGDRLANFTRFVGLQIAVHEHVVTRVSPPSAMPSEQARREGARVRVTASARG